MASIIAGIVLIIAAVLLWAGTLTLVHAMAITIGILGVLILLYGVVPVAYFRRR